MRIVRGMVVVEECTYRIECSRPSQYEVVRISDEARVGAFVTSPRFEIIEAPLGMATMRAIARVAMRTGKTNWVDALRSPPSRRGRVWHAALKPGKA